MKSEENLGTLVQFLLFKKEQTDFNEISQNRFSEEFEKKDLKEILS